MRLERVRPSVASSNCLNSASTVRWSCFRKASASLLRLAAGRAVRLAAERVAGAALAAAFTLAERGAREALVSRAAFAPPVWRAPVCRVWRWRPDIAPEAVVLDAASGGIASDADFAAFAADPARLRADAPFPACPARLCPARLCPARPRAAPERDLPPDFPAPVAAIVHSLPFRPCVVVSATVSRPHGSAPEPSRPRRAGSRWKTGNPAPHPALAGDGRANHGRGGA